MNIVEKLREFIGRTVVVEYSIGRAYSSVYGVLKEVLDDYIVVENAGVFGNRTAIVKLSNIVSISVSREDEIASGEVLPEDLPQ